MNSLQMLLRKMLARICKVRSFPKKNQILNNKKNAPPPATGS